MRIRKSNPTAGDVHINRPLTNISIAFIQDASEFVATRVFPNIPVRKQSDLYFSYSRADWLRNQAQKRAPSTESAGGGYGLANDNYFAEKWAFHQDVDDDTRTNADDPLSPDQDATAFVTHQMNLARETVWVSSYFVPGVWATDTTPGTLWDAANSTPIEDIRAQMVAVKSATGFKPNVLVLSPRVWNVLQDHPSIIARIQFGQPGAPSTASLQLLAQILELQEVMVAEAVVNSGPEGGAESTDFIVGNHALLVYRANNPGLRTPSAGYTFGWSGLLGAGAFGNRIKRFRMDELNSDRIEGEIAFDTKVVAPELGVLFEDPIS